MFENAKAAVLLAKAIRADAPKSYVPPSEGTRPETQKILPHSMLRNTRGYLERVCDQINGCYKKGWFDACAVMMRRLLETLIIEAFEHHKLDAKIKNTSGDFVSLKELIDRTTKETTFNICRSTKHALPRLKQLGDQSAHSRRYNAHREDIDKVSNDFRTACQELIYLANLK